MELSELFFKSEKLSVEEITFIKNFIRDKDSKSKEYYSAYSDYLQEEEYNVIHKINHKLSI